MQSLSQNYANQSGQCKNEIQLCNHKLKKCKQKSNLCKCTKTQEKSKQVFRKPIKVMVAMGFLRIPFKMQGKAMKSLAKTKKDRKMQSWFELSSSELLFAQLGSAQLTKMN